MNISALQAVFPVRAGMIPQPPRRSRQRVGIPRESENNPYTGELSQLSRVFAGIWLFIQLEGESNRG